MCEEAAGARLHIQRNPASARRKAQRTLSSKRPRLAPAVFYGFLIGLESDSGGPLTTDNAPQQHTSLN